MVDHDVYQSPDVGFSTMHGIFTMLSSLRVGVSSVRVGMVGVQQVPLTPTLSLIRARRDGGMRGGRWVLASESHPCA